MEYYLALTYLLSNRHLEDQIFTLYQRILSYNKKPSQSLTVTNARL